MTQTRQLAAIMFTDIVGYTALMGKDEQKAMELLKVNRDIQKSLIEEYNGKWLKEMGDGTLVSFPSASEAVYCAIKIQEEVADNTDLNLRIGIHVGEIILENGDVFGDGVNIASRLESLAPSGGIWISEPVNSNIKNKQGIETRFIKEEQLKNVDEAVRIYEVKVSGTNNSEALITSSPPSGRHNSSGRTVLISVLILTALFLIYFFYPFQAGDETTDQPITIAVLAFDDESPEGNQEHLGNGVAEAIINLLNKVEGLKTIGKASSFSFKGKGAGYREIGEALNAEVIVDGSVTVVDSIARISVQLNDAASGRLIWSDYYDLASKNLFTIIDGSAQSIASALKSELSIEELQEIGIGYEVNPEAYEYYLRAVNLHWYSRRRIEDFELSEQMFKKSIKIDSTYIEAYFGLADLYDSWDGSYEPLGTKYKYKFDSIVQIMFSIDPKSPYALLIKSYKFLEPPNLNFDSLFYYSNEAYKLDPENFNIRSIIMNWTYAAGLYNLSKDMCYTLLSKDPLNNLVKSFLYPSLLKIGALDKAKSEIEKTLSLDKNDFYALQWRFYIAIHYDQNYAQAKEIYKRLEEINSENIESERALLLAIEGHREEALSTYKSAWLYSILDMKKEALSRLDSLGTNQNYIWGFSYLNLVNMPHFEFIREEPRFKEILAEAKKVHEERVAKFSHLFVE